MKVKNYDFPMSSFLSLEKDYALIIDKISKNQRIMKMLNYETRDALKKPDLKQEQILNILENNIKTDPKIYIDPKIKTYININFDMFVPSGNPEFRNCTIIFDIVCHIDVWHLQDFQLRAYKIAGELDSMLDNQKLSGIGTIEFSGANWIPIDGDYFDICLMYHTVHGGDDKKGFLNPQDEKMFEEFFEETYNND